MKKVLPASGRPGSRGASGCHLARLPRRSGRGLAGMRPDGRRAAVTPWFKAAVTSTKAVPQGERRPPPAGAVPFPDD